MAHTSDLIGTDIEACLQQYQHKSLLRFLTCGSVDDGKSTLIGRLLYESKMFFEDQLGRYRGRLAAKFGTQGDEIDFALLVDGLVAEREQGITIDVAYRLLRDRPAQVHRCRHPRPRAIHAQHGTGASTADVAVILIDAEQGILTQTRRHSLHLVSLIGIRNVVHLAINKMDLVELIRRSVFIDKIDERSIAEFAASRSASRTITPSRLSALKGDNMISPERAHAVVPRPDADGFSGNGRSRRGTQRPVRRSACRCSGSTGPTSISAALPAPLSVARSSRVTASVCCPRDEKARWHASLPMMVTWNRVSRARQ
jgi:hypothetical protein